VFNRERKLTWICTIAIMTIFSLYVGAVLWLIPHNKIPCSCGGIIRFMSWKTHLFFNIVSTLFAVLGLNYTRKIKSMHFETRGLKINYTK